MKRSFIHVIFVCLVMFPCLTEGWPGSCSVEITGPNTVCKGNTITLEACGIPEGGSCSWSSTGGILNTSGCRATFSSMVEGEFWVNVVYSSSGEFRCYDADLITIGSRDRDNDGHYAIGSCKEPADDCNDNDPNIYPGNIEICDNKDNNCNGQVDEGLSTDADGDGHYAIGSCKKPNDDCNDNDTKIYPGATELCDNKDNNCNGKVDEGFPAGLICSVGIGACARQGIFECSADGMEAVCNALPGEPQPEVCDGIDNDCDGRIDNICPPLPVPLYKQCASPWGMDTYNYTGETICKLGCALTSAVMILRYYGVTIGIDGKEVNPRNLNEWLIKNRGYNKSGWVKWYKISEYTGYRVIFSEEMPRNDNMLNNELCSGAPVILKVPGHFVVAKGRMCSGTQETWTINDPGRNITTLQGYGNIYNAMRITRLH